MGKHFFISIIFLLIDLPFGIAQQSWYYQNPTPPLPYHLTAVEIVKENKILITNTEYKIYVSSDLGNSWGKLNEQSFSGIVEIKFIHEEIGCLITGADIFFTSDGGRSWDEIADPLPQNPKQYNSLTFTDTLSGNITGLVWTGYIDPLGLILKTTDGGLTWSYLFTNSSDLIFERCIFFDYENGFGISDRKIYCTTDGGYVWAEKYSTANYFLRDVSFVDPLDGVVVGGYGNSGVALHTTDGGQSWNSVNVYGHLWNVKHVTDLNIYASSSETGLVYSKDGGTSFYIPNSYPENVHANYLDAFNDSLIILGGGFGCVFKSTDGGVSIIESHEGTKKRIRAVDFNSSFTGIAVGDWGLVMRTTTGGSNWIEEYLTLPDDIYGIDIFNIQNVIVVTSGGKIFTSPNMGLNWEINSFSAPYSLNNIKMYDENNGIIVGDNNTYYYTTNAGENWNTGILQTGTNDLNDLCYLGFNKIILVGDHIIYTTSDGGSFWQSQNVTQNLISISRLNSNTAITCGKYNYILKTTNSGTSWYQINNPHPAQTDFVSVSFADEYTGKLAAGRERIYKSSDGGETWQLDIDIDVTTVTGDLLNDVYMINSFDAIAVGKYGLIMSTLKDHVVPIELNNENNNALIGIRNFLLAQNYPNPFNPTTKIKYTIPNTPLSFGEELGVRLIVYDLLGNEIATLVNEEQQPGEYEVEFNLTGLPSGIYFYQLKAGTFVQTKKMVLLR